MLHFYLVIGKALSMFGKLSVSICFSAANFMKSKHRASISNKNSASRLRCFMSIKYTEGSEILILKNNIKYLINNFILITC